MIEVLVGQWRELPGGDEQAVLVVADDRDNGDCAYLEGMKATALGTYIYRSGRAEWAPRTFAALTTIGRIDPALRDPCHRESALGRAADDIAGLVPMTPSKPAPAPERPFVPRKIFGAL